MALIARLPLMAGIVEHEDLSGRELLDQHPMDAITGLKDEVRRIDADIAFYAEHENLSGRGRGDAHPISSITNLQNELNALGVEIEYYSHHNNLTEREDLDSHPIIAISGLKDELLRLSSHRNLEEKGHPDEHPIIAITGLTEKLAELEANTSLYSNHTNLNERDHPDQHPIDSITGLHDKLHEIDDGIDTVETTLGELMTLLEGTTYLSINTINLTRELRGVTTVEKSLFPVDTLFTMNSTLFSDMNGTIGVYIGEQGANAVTVLTIATSLIDDIKVLLGNVPTHADLPITMTDATSLFARTPTVGDYANVLADETITDSPLVRWYITAITGDVISWGNYLILNTSTYQAQTSASDNGKILTGGAQSGTFGESLAMESVLSGTAKVMPDSKAVKDYIDGGFEPESEKGAPNGYAPLDANGKVPAENLPAGQDLTGVELTANKGAANGYTPLGADGKVPPAYLPTVANSELQINKGVANGYAPLDSSAKVPYANLPASLQNVEITLNKGIPGGYPNLDSSGKVPLSQLPDGIGGGVTVHNDLTGRSAVDTHPMDAITGLTTFTANVAAEFASINQAIVTANARIDGTVYLSLSTVSLSQSLRGTTTVPKNLFSPDQEFRANATLFSDNIGTLGVCTQDNGDNITVMTISLPGGVSGDEGKVLLGNVATHADLPATVTDATSAFGRTPTVGDYANVIQDETIDGDPLVRWYVTQIDTDDDLYWGNALVLNTSNYQSQSAAGDNGKILTGGVVSGTFGPSLPVESTLSGTPGVIPDSQAVSDAIAAGGGGGGGGGTLDNVEIFAVSGTWTAPATRTYTFYVIGGGGAGGSGTGGGGGTGATSAGFQTAAAGGGAGGVDSIQVALHIGDECNIIVGAGGSRASGLSPSGGYSSLTLPNSIKVSGGGGGAGGNNGWRDTTWGTGSGGGGGGGLGEASGASNSGSSGGSGGGNNAGVGGSGGFPDGNSTDGGNGGNSTGGKHVQGATVAGGIGGISTFPEHPSVPATIGAGGNGANKVAGVLAGLPGYSGAVLIFW